ncbi:MAG TPA: thiamine pyrophosphate-binding protein [Candidatus Nanopelagicaceae bacterium]
MGEQPLNSQEDAVTRRFHGGDLLTALLIEHEVAHVFGLPGGQTYALYDGINHRPNEIEHVLVRDERTGVYAADGYARVTGKVGVCDATVGPGAANLPAGLGEAFGASIPIVALVSELPAKLILHQYRSAASQAMDQVGLLAPVTKWHATVPDLKTMPELVRQAFREATSGRPGPTVLFLPQDVLDSTLPPEMLELLHRSSAEAVGSSPARFGAFPSFRPAPDPADVTMALQVLATAHRPIIIAGGGVVMAGAEAILTEFAETISAAVATSLSGKGSIAENHPLSVGVVGAMGTPSASAALDAADVVFLVATKAGSGPTFNWTRPRKDQIVIQMDIDPAELGRVFPLAAAMFADARSGLQAIVAGIAHQGGTPVDRTQWRREIEGFNQDWRAKRDAERSSDATPILPQRVLGDLETALGTEDIVVCDASLSSGWAGVYLEQIPVGRRVLMPRGLAGLGYSLPAAIGVAMANRDRRTIVLTGDGALGYSVGEFATVLELQLPITVIVLNNRSLGWIRWYSRINFDSGWQKDDFADIDYSAVAKAYGWSAERIVDPSQLASAIKQALNSKEPSLLDIVTETWTTPVSGHRRALDLGTTTGYGG